MKALFFALPLILLFSCRFGKGKEQPDGGPCSYKSTPYPALVIFLDTTNSEISNIWCRVPDFQSDTVDYYHVNNRYAPISLIQESALKPGDTLIYEHHEITDGSCNPDVFSLLLKQEINQK